MAQITKKDIDQLLDKRFLPLMKVLNQSIALLTHVAEDVGILKEDMKDVKATVDSHTTTLDKILKKAGDWNTEAASLRSAIKRHEEWINQIASKVGVDLKAD